MKIIANEEQTDWRPFVGKLQAKQAMTNRDTLCICIRLML